MPLKKLRDNPLCGANFKTAQMVSNWQGPPKWLYPAKIKEILGGALPV
jgi:hypothetical protein